MVASALVQVAVAAGPAIQIAAGATAVLPVADGYVWTLQSTTQVRSWNLLLRSPDSRVDGWTYGINLQGGSQPNAPNSIIYRAPRGAWVAEFTSTVIDVFGTPVVQTGTIVVPGDGGITVTAFGATGDGTSDDTVACQAAAIAWQTQMLAGGSAPLYFPAGKYRITSLITVTGVRGGLIYGDAHNASILLESENAGNQMAGKLGMLVLTNCQDVTVMDLAFQPAQHILSVTSASATSATIGTGGGQGFPQAGQLIVFGTGDYQTYYETCHVVTADPVGGVLTLSKALEHTYGPGDWCGFGVTSAWCCYSDQSLPGAQTSTHNKFIRCTVSRPIPYQAIYGHLSACKGGGPVRITSPITGGVTTSFTVEDIGWLAVGTRNVMFSTSYVSFGDIVSIQSLTPSTRTVTLTAPVPDSYASGTWLVGSAGTDGHGVVGIGSDVNNDDHVLIDCKFDNVVRAIGTVGQNALLHMVSRPLIGGNTWCALSNRYGGQFSVQGGGIGVNGWTWEGGTYLQHPILLEGLVIEGPGGAGPFAQSPSAWGTQGLNLFVSKIDKKTGVNAGTRTVNLTSADMVVQFTDGVFGDNGDWYLADSAHSGLQLQATLDVKDTYMFARNVSLDSVYFDDQARWSLASLSALTPTLLNGARWEGFPLWTCGAPDGVIRARIEQLSGAVAISAGTNDIPLRGQHVELTGAAGAVTLRGIQTPPLYGVRVSVACLFNQAITIANAGTPAAGYSKIYTGTGANMTVAAPGGFTTFDFVYSAIADGSNPGWRLLTSRTS